MVTTVDEERRRAGERAVDRLVAASTVALAPFVGLCALRWLHLDGTATAVKALTFLPWLLAPVWLLLGVGIGARRLGLALPAAALALTHVVWVAPEIPWRTTISAEAAVAPTLEVMTANVFYENPDPGAVLDEIAAFDPDVVALQEMDVRARRVLDAHPLAASHPYRAVAPTWPDTLLLSRRPLRDAGWVQGTRGMPHATVEVDGREVVVVAVHVTAPVSDVDAWDRDLDALTEWAAGRDGRVVLLGDFNATTQHRPFRRLLDTGLDDAHTEQGRGWGATWPRDGFGPFGPLLRLDHVLVGGRLETVEVARGAGPGSDHLPVRARIAVLDRAP